MNALWSDLAWLVTRAVVRAVLVTAVVVTALEWVAR
jgi:hypothetical protein